MKTALRFSALVGIVLIVITVTPITGWYAHWLAGSFSDPGGTTLVVLGGSSLEPGIIATIATGAPSMPSEPIASGTTRGSS